MRRCGVPCVTSHWSAHPPIACPRHSHTLHGVSVPVGDSGRRGHPAGSTATWTWTLTSGPGCATPPPTPGYRWRGSGAATTRTQARPRSRSASTARPVHRRRHRLHCAGELGPTPCTATAATTVVGACALRYGRADAHSAPALVRCVAVHPGAAYHPLRAVWCIRCTWHTAPRQIWAGKG